MVGPGGVVTVAQRNAKAFRRGDAIDLRGQDAPTPEDLAVLARVYRDPRYETVRIIYFKGDTIVDPGGVTSRMPEQAPLTMNAVAGPGVSTVSDIW